ncbi:MAG: N-acetyltransferase [Actinomycetota bacterium]|nr:N-acetyltransferase [Actinomycetota bacterium]
MSELARAVLCRAERPGEVAAVRDVVVRSFGGPVVANLVEALRVTTSWLPGLSFVAEYDGAVIGQALFTRRVLDAPRRLVDVLVLSPVGLLPRFQGRGIGTALIRHGLDAVRQRAEPLVFLEGSPRYYPRFGFEPGEPLGFRRPSLRIPEPAFQVLKLSAYEPWMTGTLVYPQAFWDLDCVGLRDPNA